MLSNFHERALILNCISVKDSCADWTPGKHSGEVQALPSTQRARKQTEGGAGFHLPQLILPEGPLASTSLAVETNQC